MKPKPKPSNKSASWATASSPNGRRNPNRLREPKRGPRIRSYDRTEKKTFDLAFDLRGHLRLGTAPTSGPTGSPGEAFLQLGPDQTERLLFAIAASLDGFWGRRIVFGGDPQS